MNAFKFKAQVADAYKLLKAMRGTTLDSSPVVYVRLKDGSEIPVTAVKVRLNRIILETFVDET